MDRRAKGGMRGAFSGTGLRHRIDGDRVLVTADSIAPLYIAELQDRDGRLRDDAAWRLTSDLYGADLTEGAKAFIETNGVELEHLGRNERTQLALLAGHDALSFVQELLDDDVHALHAYHLGMRREGWMRFAWWQFVDWVAAGGNPDEFSYETANGELTDGVPAGQLALIVTPPMAARQQPSVMVFLTGHGSTLVLVPTSGGGFHRDVYVPPWPVGVSATNIGGTGTGAYTGVENHTPGYAGQLLADLVRGANKTLGHITDPAQWVGDDGTLDVDERRITWASVRFGLDALKNVGAHFGAPTSIWEAYRSIGTLQGIWEGSRKNSVHLGWLLDPTTIREVAIAAIPNHEHRKWAGVVVDNFERAMTAAFGSDEEELRPDIPPRPARAMANLRNLVHGAGDQGGKRRRSERFELLGQVERSQSNLMLVREVAGLWWCAALCDPERFLSSGHRPW